MTVAEIRKAIEGLPDEAFVCLHCYFTEDSDYTNSFFIQLKETRSEGGGLILQADVAISSDLDDDDDDEDDDDLDDEDEDD